MNLIDHSLIKVGAVLKTRRGSKARILCTDRKSDYDPHCVLGLASVPGGETTVSWKRDGRGYYAHDDLISIWTEPVEWDWSTTPPWLNWLAMDKDGGWVLHQEEPEIPRKYLWWDSSLESAGIPNDFSPKWTGDWKESLTKRP